MAIRKKGRPKKPSVKTHFLDFEVKDYWLSTSIGRNSLPLGRKFDDVDDDFKICQITTYIGMNGVRIHYDESLEITLYVKKDARTDRETKADYREHVATENGWEPKTRVRKGLRAPVYREIRGSGYCSKGRDDDKKPVWRLSVDYLPDYASHVLHLLEMDKTTVVSAHVSQEGPTIGWAIFR